MNTNNKFSQIKVKYLNTDYSIWNNGYLSTNINENFL